jgi:hypothetical protein
MNEMGTWISWCYGTLPGILSNGINLIFIGMFENKSEKSNSLVFPDGSWGLLLVQDSPLTGGAPDHVPGFQVDLF